MPRWLGRINQRERCRAVVVPCDHNAQVFREGGVTKPIHVIHGGTDPQEFPLITERPNRPYTFWRLGTVAQGKVGRKSTAFFKGFPNASGCKANRQG